MAGGIWAIREEEAEYSLVELFFCDMQLLCAKEVIASHPGKEQLSGILLPYYLLIPWHHGIESGVPSQYKYVLQCLTLEIHSPLQYHKQLNTQYRSLKYIINWNNVILVVFDVCVSQCLILVIQTSVPFWDSNPYSKYPILSLFVALFFLLVKGVQIVKNSDSQNMDPCLNVT